MSESVQQSIELLKTQGLRITAPRKAILEVLATAEGPFSSEETFGQLKDGSCDLVTVYRCLDQFEKSGIVESGVRENGTKVYCFGHGHGHHHHLTCRSCGRTERIDLCMGKELEAVAKSFGFTKVTHIMEVFGNCPVCV